MIWTLTIAAIFLVFIPFAGCMGAISAYYRARTRQIEGMKMEDWIYKAAKARKSAREN